MKKSPTYSVQGTDGTWNCYDYDMAWEGKPGVQTHCDGPNGKVFDQKIPNKAFHTTQVERLTMVVTPPTQVVETIPVVETVNVNPAPVTTTPYPSEVCTETTASSGAITKKCCVGSVCNSKIIAKDTAACDCDENFKYAINDAISRGNVQELADLRARQGACFARCRTPEPVVTRKKKTKEVATVTPSKPTVRDRRRVVYSSGNQ